MVNIKWNRNSEDTAECDYGCAIFRNGELKVIELAKSAVKFDSPKEAIEYLSNMESFLRTLRTHMSGAANGPTSVL